MEHHAVVSCFLRDTQSGKIFGLTNKHVTLFASNGIYIKLLNGETVELCSQDSLRFHDLSKHVDVSIFEIDTDKGIELSNLIPNLSGCSGKKYNIEIYNGSLDNLFGKQVFKYRSQEGNVSNQLSNIYHDTATKGIVVEGKTHTGTVDNTATAYFYVKGDLEPFSVEGESGTIVVILEDGIVKLVGVVVGGEKNTNYTCCFCMSFVMKKLAEYFNIQPELFTTYVGGKRRSGIEISLQDVTLRPGTTIYVQKANRLFPSPKRSASVVVIHDEVMRLLSLNFNNLASDSYVLVNRKELKKLVNQRKTLDGCHIFKNENPDYVVMNNGVKACDACDALYSGDIRRAEMKLKKALLGVRISVETGSGMFAELITYITWFHTTDSRQKMEELLNEGIEFYEEYKTLKHFPKHSGMYLYYDLSRLFLRQFELLIHNVESTNRENATILKEKAIKHAKTSVDIAERIHVTEPSEESYRRLVLMKAEYAYILLACGHSFNVDCPLNTLNADDINEAESVLKEIGKDTVYEMPFVQSINYRLTKCDLFYRRGKPRQALKLAAECFDDATHAGYKVAASRAKCRVEKLGKLQLHN